MNAQYAGYWWLKTKSDLLAKLRKESSKFANLPIRSTESAHERCTSDWSMAGNSI